MKSTQIFQKIKSDEFYLLNSYTLNMVMLVAVIIALKVFHMTPSYSLGGYTWIFIVLGVIHGLICASFLHNTAHNNIKNIWLNRLVGEYSGFNALYGYSNFVMIHILHHQHSDEELDPVNPKGMDFLTFLSAPMRYIIKSTKIFLFQTHGHKPHYQKIMQLQTFVFNANLILRAYVLYLFLGKGLFFSFYIPSFLGLVAIFAHINYACHRNAEDDSVEIVNLNHNLYYKIANFITIGGYFHKNHHLNMNLFDPRKLNTQRSKAPLFSVPQNPLYRKDPNVSYGGSFLAKYFTINDVWGEATKNRIPQRVTLRKFSLRKS